MVQKLLKCLPSGWSVKSVHAITMGWSAELAFKNLQFALVEDRLCWELRAKKRGKWQAIQIPENAFLEQLADALQREAAELIKENDP